MTPNEPVNPGQGQRGFGGPRGFGGSFGGIALIGIGLIFFLDNLGFIPNLRALWPLWLSAWGVVLLVRTRNPSCSVWGFTLIAVGVLVTAGNLHLIHANMRNIWPIWLIAAGVSLLLRRNGQCGPSRWERKRHDHSTTTFVDNRLHQNAVFASVNHRIDSPTFEGADLNATFGELKLDLRGTNISTPDRRAIIDTDASFGSIKLRVPETWKIVVEGSAAFGSFEDKTIPPRPVPGVDPPTLILRGSAAFGSVEIEN